MQREKQEAYLPAQFSPVGSIRLGRVFSWLTRTKRGCSSWYVGWYEAEGQRKKKSFGAKKNDANQFCAIKSAELTQGYRACEWSNFVADFKERKAAGLKPQSIEANDIAIRNFERVMEPDKVSEITTATVDVFRARRAAERGKKPGSKTSPATVNKELRALKRLFRVAK